MAERRNNAHICAAWAFKNIVGRKAALRDDHFKDLGLTRNMVQLLLTELKARGAKERTDASRDHPKQILTEDERIKLAEWILACADGKCRTDRTAVSFKVRERLRARHTANKRRH